MSPFSKTFEPAELESCWTRFWLERGYFKANRTSSSSRFSMVLPPPNVTGSLHTEHALGVTLQDIVVRRKRMQGHDTLWLPGIDHAGIATQNFVESKLAEEGQDRWSLGREAFLDRIWALKEESGNTIVNQLKGLGGSFDWSRMRFTLEPQLSKAVIEAFVGLYREGIAYRGEHIVNSCPRCRTAVSEPEIRYREVEGKVYTVSFALAGSNRHVRASLTRPETLLGACALAVNPEDERYRGLVGKKVILPLVGRTLSIVSDAAVDQHSGTGVAVVCPAHDITDFDIARRHGLTPIAVLDSSGVMNEQTGRLAGLDRFRARKEIVVYLRSSRALEASRPDRQLLGYCDRCDAHIEPILSTQWFVRSEPLVGPAIEALKREEVRFVPEAWAATCIESLRAADDWCISRQSWWGHPIPAWYCRHTGEEHVTVSAGKVAECAECHGTALERDDDVLDTWFSASLWPFAALGWPDRTVDLERYYPTDLLVTGPDILVPWVSRTLMMGLLLTSEVPFRRVLITPLVKDERGQKMSKSRGTGVNPLSALARYGTDAVRFALAERAVPGADVTVDSRDLARSQRLALRLWNGARFVATCADASLEPRLFQSRAVEKPLDSLGLAHRWILSRSSRVAAEVGSDIEQLRIDRASEALRVFLEELLDYLEIVRHLTRGKSDPMTQGMVGGVFDRGLRLLHPFMPFITEEIWQSLSLDGESISVAAFPEAVPEWDDSRAEAEMSTVRSVVDVVRRARSEYNVDATRRIEVILGSQDPDAETLLSLLSRHRDIIIALGWIGELTIGGDGSERPGAVRQTAGRVEVALVLAEGFDRDAEIGRLSRNVGKIERELETLAKKLSNEDFTSKATTEVVRATQDKYADLQKKKRKIEEGLRALRQ